MSRDTPRRITWSLAIVVILGAATLVRIFFVEEPVPVLPPQAPPPLPKLPNNSLPDPNSSGDSTNSLSTDVPRLLESALRIAEEARPQVQTRRDEAARQYSQTGLLVPIPLQAKTQRQVDDEFFQYRLQELKAYRQLTQDEPIAKEAGEQFLRAYLEQDAGRGQVSGWETIWKLGRTALEAGSGDPLIRTHVAHARLMARQGDGDLEDIFNESLPRLLELNYPRGIEALARIRLTQLSRSRQGRISRKKFWPPAVVGLVRWLEEESENPEHRSGVLRRLMPIWESADTDERLLLLSGCLQSQRIDPWLLHILLGQHELRVGWAMRGTSTADQVNEQRWKVFHNHLKRASRHLQYAWYRHPELPDAAVKMISVAMANGDGEQNPHEWFLRSIEAQFDQIDAYTALWYSLTPRWGGSLQEMQDFGQRCLETDRFDTEVPGVLARILEDIREEELEPEQTMATNTRAHPLLRELLTCRNEYRRRNPGKPLPLDEPLRRTRLAKQLQVCELPAEAVAEFLALGDEVRQHPLQRGGTAGVYELGLLLAAQGDVQPKVLALADRLHRTWDPAAAPDVVVETEAWLRELAPTAIHPSATRFYQHAETMLQQLRGFSAGEWVTLTFDPDLLGWEIYADDWRIEADSGALRLTCIEDGVPRLHLRTLAAFRPPFVVEAIIEVSDPAPFPYAAGISLFTGPVPPTLAALVHQPLFGTAADLFYDSKANLSERKDLGYFPGSGRGFSGNKFLLPKTGPHQLRLKLWPEAYEYRIDDKLRTGINPQGLEPSAGLCFGEPHPNRIPYGQTYTRHSGELRLSNIRIRRLDIARPPDDSIPKAEQVDYWQARLVDEPDDPQVNMQLAWVRYEQQRPEEAITHARRAKNICPEIEGIHGLFGRIAYDAGRLHEAAMELELSVRELRENVIETAYLAEILATAPDEKLRRGQRAKQLAESVLYLPGGNHPLVLSALAAAHAELGEFHRAVEFNAMAIEMSNDSDKPRLRQRQELYMARQPYRSGKSTD